MNNKENVLYIYTYNNLYEGAEHFSVKCQIVSILVFGDYRTFCITIQLCFLSLKSAINNKQTNGCGCSSKTLFPKIEDQIWPQSCGSPNPGL